ncbi:MAG TPA: hypothetical protein VFV50_08920 [Bdellovibrionales bacterium]|nr:hypothetical protein [Bdellovibrionales bacterium]
MKTLIVTTVLVLGFLTSADAKARVRFQPGEGKTPIYEKPPAGAGAEERVYDCAERFWCTPIDRPWRPVPIELEEWLWELF